MSPHSSLCPGIARWSAFSDQVCQMRAYIIRRILLIGPHPVHMLSIIVFLSVRFHPR